MKSAKNNGVYFFYRSFLSVLAHNVIDSIFYSIVTPSITNRGSNYLTTKCSCVFENFIFKEPKMKLGSVCKADRAQSNGPTLRSLASFHFELQQRCC